MRWHTLHSIWANGATSPIKAYSSYNCNSNESNFAWGSFAFHKLGSPPIAKRNSDQQPSKTYSQHQTLL